MQAMRCFSQKPPNYATKNITVLRKHIWPKPRFDMYKLVFMICAKNQKFWLIYPHWPRVIGSTISSGQYFIRWAQFDPNFCYMQRETVMITSFWNNWELEWRCDVMIKKTISTIRYLNHLSLGEGIALGFSRNRFTSFKMKLRPYVRATFFLLMSKAWSFNII